MYNNVMAARDRGVSLAFLSGNWICWEIEMNRSSIRGLIGWEYHGAATSISGLEVVAEAPLFPQNGWDGETGRDRSHGAAAFRRRAPCSKWNGVFNAGTIW